MHQGQGRSAGHSTTPDPVARARSVVEVLQAAAPRIDAGRALPDDVVSELHRARLFRLLLPPWLGGDACDLKTLARTIEIIASADGSTGWCMGQGSGCAMAAAFLDRETAQRFFGPANAVLAWGAGIQGKAVACDGGYQVTGRWQFASGSANATLLGAHCYVYEADGSPRLKANGKPQDRTALMLKSKAEIEDVWHTVGLRGTASNTYAVRDLFVPANETIDRDNPAELRQSETLYLFPTTQAYAAGFSGLMLGIAQGTINDLKQLAMTKTPRGAPSSLQESPVFQTDLARMEARLRAARAYLHATLDETWEAVDHARSLSLEQRGAIKLATTFVINEGAAIVTEGYRAAGATAIFQSNTFERRLRDALSGSQQTQGRNTNFITAGRMLLGLPPDTMMFL